MFLAKQETKTIPFTAMVVPSWTGCIAENEIVDMFS